MSKGLFPILGQQKSGGLALALESVIVFPPGRLPWGVGAGIAKGSQNPSHDESMGAGLSRHRIVFGYLFGPLLLGSLSPPTSPP
jgi:hypothetical protein